MNSQINRNMFHPAVFIFFSLSLFLKEKFLCHFFFPYILGRGLMSHGVSLCKTPTEVQVTQVITLFTAVHQQ